MVNVVIKLTAVAVKPKTSCGAVSVRPLLTPTKHVDENQKKLLCNMSSDGDNSDLQSFAFKLDADRL